MAGKARTLVFATADPVPLGGFVLPQAGMLNMPVSVENDATSNGMRIIDDSINVMLPVEGAPGGHSQFVVTLRVFRVAENDVEKQAVAAIKAKSATSKATRDATTLAMVETRINENVKIAKESIAQGLTIALDAENRRQALADQARKIMAEHGIKL